MDEPLVTQPQMYAIVQKHPTVKDMYAKQSFRSRSYYGRRSKCS